MLWSRPGVVSDDTKTYLYLDPGRYVRAAISLWTPSVGMGTVTHENIGYLLPMGPFYWVLAELHVPLWIAQRLWMGCLLFAAGAGALYLCRVIGLRGPGRYVTALAFMYTPYVLQYAGRISVILMPWAGLPWMIAFVILATRRGGWRYPALFALVVALVSGINASSIIYVGIAPVLWLPYAVVVAREATWRRAWGVAWRTGLLCALVSLWWAVGLQIEAAYGVNVLKYTETVPATSSASLASEILRGLGYWYFYGADRVGPWTQNMVAYTQNIALILLSFLLPALCFLAAVFSRWRYRSYFVLITVVGTVLAVGPNPYTAPVRRRLSHQVLHGRHHGRPRPALHRPGLPARDPRPGHLPGRRGHRRLRPGPTARPGRRGGGRRGGGRGHRSRCGPAGSWPTASPSRPARPPTCARRRRPSTSAHPGTRVYALPGNDFAADRWGDTVDTVYPGLMTRPFVTHEQQIMGSLATADVLHAVDTPLQDGVMDWNALAPMASLMDAGDVLVQYDQAYERYDTPDPQQLALDLATTPPGLSDPVGYGTPRPNISLIPRLRRGGPGPPGRTRAGRPRSSPTRWPTPGPSSGPSRRPPPRGRRGRRRHRRRRRRRPAVRQPDHLLRRHPRHRRPAAGRHARRPGRPGGDRHQPQAGLPVEHPEREHGLHRDGVPGPRHLRPDRRPPQPVPRRPRPTRRPRPSCPASSRSPPRPTDRPSPTCPRTARRPPSTATSTRPGSRTRLSSSSGSGGRPPFRPPKTIDTLVLVQPLNGVFDRTISRVRLTFDGGHAVSASLGPASLTAAGQVLHFSSPGPSARCASR